MASPPLFILLCSGEHEKIQMAAMVASVAAVSERTVQIFVSMNAILAFKKDSKPQDRYRGGKFSELMQEKKAPDAIGLISQGAELGDLKVFACSLALDVAGLEMEHLADVFTGPLGLTKFLSDAEAGQLMTL